MQLNSLLCNNASHNALDLVGEELAERKRLDFPIASHAFSVQSIIQSISDVDKRTHLVPLCPYLNVSQQTQLSLTNRATRLEVSQGHQTWYHLMC